MSQPPYSPTPAPGDPNSAYQNPASPHPGYQQPGGQAQYPVYQNAPPAGYGAGAGMPPPPPGWGAPPPPPPLTRPTTVTYAILALLLNIVLGVTAAILVFANRDAYLQQALVNAGLAPEGTPLDPEGAQFASDILGNGFRVVALVGLVFLGVWAMFLWFAWKGHNWARIVIWVFGGLSLIGLFGAFSSPVGVIVVLNVVNLLLTLGAVVLLALKASNDWYRYHGDARKYGWPGRA